MAEWRDGEMGGMVRWVGWWDGWGAGWADVGMADRHEWWDGGMAGRHEWWDGGMAGREGRPYVAPHLLRCSCRVSSF